jgi:hypothetical protein
MKLSECKPILQRRPARFAFHDAAVRPSWHMLDIPRIVGLLDGLHNDCFEWKAVSDLLQCQ